MKTIKKLFFVTLMGCLVVQGFAQVNKTVQPGEMFTIPSATPATAGSIYRWWVNNAQIPGAVGASYTGSLTTEGNYTFIRQAIQPDECNEWTSSNPYVIAVVCGKITLTGSNSSQTVCVGANITPIQYTTEGVGNNDVQVANLPDGVNAAWASNTLTISGAPSVAGDYIVYLCGQEIATGSIKNYPLSATPVASSVTQTVCLGTAISNILYSTCGVTNDSQVTVSNLPAGLTAVWASNVLTISGVPTASNNFTVVLNGENVATGSINVATPTLQLVSGSGAVTQSIQVETAISPIKFVATNASSITFSGALPAVVSGAYAANTYTISGTKTEWDNAAYTVTTTNSNGCVNASMSGSITTADKYRCTRTVLNLGNIKFASTSTWSQNGIILSDYVSFDGPASNATACFNQSSSNNPFIGQIMNYEGTSWVNWCAVLQYKNQLCPSPWRVPTKEDWCQFAGVTTSCNSEWASTNYFTLGQSWRGTGWWRNAGHSSTTFGMVWSVSPNPSDTATAYGFSPQNGNNVMIYQPFDKARGMPLRCVR